MEVVAVVAAAHRLAEEVAAPAAEYKLAWGVAVAAVVEVGRESDSMMYFKKILGNRN